MIWTPAADWPPAVQNLSILDSSFNPPTRAHLALASLSSLSNNRQTPGSESSHALLLLLSVQNADKPPPDPARDASYAQRLQMMILLAQELGPHTAVAVTSEPTFVGKARVLRRWLNAQKAGPPADASLSFLVGYDTLQRILAPKYYGNTEAMRAALGTFFGEHGARLLVARRDAAAYPAFDGAPDLEAHLAEFHAAIETVDMQDEDGVAVDDLMKISSSAVRKAVSRDDTGWKDIASPCIVDYIRQQHLYRAA